MSKSIKSNQLIPKYQQSTNKKGIQLLDKNILNGLYINQTDLSPHQQKITLEQQNIYKNIANQISKQEEYLENVIRKDDPKQYNQIKRQQAINRAVKNKNEIARWVDADGNLRSDYGASPAMSGTDPVARDIIFGITASPIMKGLSYLSTATPQLLHRVIYSTNPKSQYLRYVIGKFKYGFDAQIPDLIRRTAKPMPSVNLLRHRNNIKVVSPLENRFRFKNNGNPNPVITNFSTDLPVIPNNGGSWAGSNINIIKGKTLLGKNVISTRPQDTFTYGDIIKVPKKYITTISSKQGTVPEEELMTEFFKKYKRPTQKDYQFMDYVFQPKYKSEVIPVTPVRVDNINHPLFKYLSDADMRRRINQPWKNVMYDIAPTVESEFRNELGIVLRSQVPLEILMK